jgi:hypothetical protein
VRAAWLCYPPYWFTDGTSTLAEATADWSSGRAGPASPVEWLPGRRSAVLGWPGGGEEFGEQLVDALGLVVVDPVGGAGPALDAVQVGHVVVLGLGEFEEGAGELRVRFIFDPLARLPVRLRNDLTFGGGRDAEALEYVYAASSATAKPDKGHAGPGGRGSEAARVTP